MYLNKEETKTLNDVCKVLIAQDALGNLSAEQHDIAVGFYKLLCDSETHSSECRDKAKRFVQEKRKTDKSYAHTRNKKGEVN